MLLEDLGLFRLKPQLLSRNPLDLSKCFFDLVEPFLALMSLSRKSHIVRAV